LIVLFHSPAALGELEEGGDYRARFPDGRDLVDYVNQGRLGAIALRWPEAAHWLRFSCTADREVIARASDHVLLSVEVSGGELCVRGADDLFCWRRGCPDDRVVRMANGIYAVTACMALYSGSGPVRIFLHFAPTAAKPDLGYSSVPELFGEAPVH